MTYCSAGPGQTTDTRWQLHDCGSALRLEPRTEEDSGDIYAPPGTEIRLHIHTDRPARSGEMALGDAVREAKAFVTKAIREGFALGRGVGQLRHFLAEW